ncbi:MAG TPA: SpoIID/LytB domain-containing protein, partial [Blastocatellia bacterium]|nr:SpoIID/LytB domain-containing protein [Blastocatellia bacterium]
AFGAQCPTAHDRRPRGRPYSRLDRAHRGAKEQRAATPGVIYRVEVAALRDPRKAHKLTEDLRKEFSEQTAISYDEEADRYRVLLGRFTARRDAADMVEQLKREDYDEARIITEPLPPERVAAQRPKPRSDEKSAPGAYRPKARYSEASGKTSESLATQSGLQVVAFEAARLLAASEDVLIVSPASGPTEKQILDSTSKSSRSADRDAKRQPDKKDGAGRDEASSRKPQFVRVGNKEYRGEIHLALNPRGQINVINVLPMEEYLRGVVPLELSPASFPEIEALKAQAIAARSYALASRGRFSGEGYDLKDTAQSQVYGGLSAEHPLTNRAVEETSGMVALHVLEDGRLIPIEALYTSTCGGRTENNESVFLGPASPYLRSVECAPDRHLIERREITSNRTIDSAAEGRSTARDAAMLEVLGFALPNRINGQYLRAAAEPGELVRWADRVAQLFRGARAKAPRGDLTRLPAFAQLIAAAVYGDGRASLLLSPADTDYILSGLGGADIADDMRADVAMLMKEGILRVPAEGRISARVTITRAYAIETFACAVSSKPELSGLKIKTAKAVEGNRLIASETSASSKTGQQATTALEVERGAWLFRRLGDQSYIVDRIALAGGERITYHLNAAGRIDLLEAEISERGAASDRFSNFSYWQERVTADELRRRLARSNIMVGEIEEITPIEHGPSNRVVELEVTGREKSQRLRGFRIRTALGLKESLFVIATERDEQGRALAFVFTGRGWGHGVGLCQTGAYGLAKEGYSSIAILQKYYTGVKVQKIY